MEQTNVDRLYIWADHIADYQLYHDRFSLYMLSEGPRDSHGHFPARGTGTVGCAAGEAYFLFHEHLTMTFDDSMGNRPSRFFRCRGKIHTPDLL